MKKLAFILMFVSSTVFAQASSQGCQSSGNTAAGCATNNGGDGGNGGNGGAGGAGGSSYSASTNTNNNTVSTANVQGQIQGQGQKQSTENSNNTNVTVQGSNYEARRIPVNTAFAPSIAPTANCALSVSGGVSVIGFSTSFGKAYIDENCAALEKIRNVALVLGDVETAEAMMCQDKAYAKARASVGKACSK